MELETFCMDSSSVTTVYFLNLYRCQSHTVGKSNPILSPLIGATLQSLRRERNIPAFLSSNWRGIEFWPPSCKWGALPLIYSCVFSGISLTKMRDALLTFKWVELIAQKMNPVRGGWWRALNCLHPCRAYTGFWIITDSLFGERVPDRCHLPRADTILLAALFHSVSSACYPLVSLLPWGCQHVAVPALVLSTAT